MPKPAPKKAETKSTAPPGRPIKYPEVQVRLLSGKDAMTVEQAKEFMGWQEESADIKFGNDFLLTDEHGTKIRCLNNTGNRPFYENLARDYAQEILNKRWSGPNGNGKSINGESGIIGKTGQIISLQHRATGLILAEQIRTGEQADHWKQFWKGPVVMDLLMVLGVDESDEVVNTVDRGKSRSETDVLYRSPYFANLPPAKRKDRARSTAYAVKLLWHRTGAGLDAFAPRRTHAELFDFIDRHQHVIKAVTHVAEENDDNAIGKFISPGYAAGLLVLMGCSESTPEQVGKYRQDRNERHLSWKAWDLACEFWVMLGKSSTEFHEVRQALAALTDPDTGTGGSLAEKTAVLVKAWNLFSTKGALTPKNLELTYTEADDDGFRRLIEIPVIDGIDLGNPKAEKDDEEGDEEVPTEEEVEKAKEEVRAEREKPSPKPKGKPPTSQQQADAAATEALLKRLWEAHPGKVLLVQLPSGEYQAFGKDATAVASELNGKVQKQPATGLNVYKLDEAGFKEVVKRLHGHSRKVGIVTEDAGGNLEVKDVTPPPMPKGKPQPKPGGPKQSALKAEQLKKLEGK